MSDPSEGWSRYDFELDINDQQDAMPFCDLVDRKWEQYIGDVETAERVLGQNAPEGYIDLVIEREAAIDDLQKRKDELRKQLLQPLKEWRGNQRLGLRLDDPHLDKIYKEYRRRCNIVRSELFPEDGEFVSTKWRLAEIDRRLHKVYRIYLEEISKNQHDTKKDRIIELKRAFPYLRVSNDLVAAVVGTTMSYAQQIKYLPEEGVRDRQVPTRLRNQTLERDEYACVRCGASEELEAHHIIPRHEGGPDDLENMATLCSDCHSEVHRGIVYEDKTEFWDEYAQ